MNFLRYLNISKPALDAYVEAGWLQVAHHDTFPLDMYTYTRQTVYEHNWDSVTSKCRGVIIHRDTLEIVARPFEKFHNYGSTTPVGDSQAIPVGEPVIWEKMDGFMCTAYTWEGRNYIASKGSFHSPHAKWATAWLHKHEARFGPTNIIGHTLVFEGLHKDLRIVIDYGLKQCLVLLAVINNETGEEVSPDALRKIGRDRHMDTPLQHNISLQEAATQTRSERQPDGPDLEEGYVLTWYRNGQTPFRLKMKYIEYLRLHRLVTGMSPKHIWETLSQGLNTSEYVENSTPWFKAFFEKWQRVFLKEYDRIMGESHTRFQCAQTLLGNRSELGWRKSYAEFFLKEKNKPYQAVLFAMLDDKKVAPIIWKMVKGLAKNAHTLRDATQ